MLLVAYYTGGRPFSSPHDPILLPTICPTVVIPPPYFHKLYLTSIVSGLPLPFQRTRHSILLDLVTGLPLFLVLLKAVNSKVCKEAKIHAFR